MEILKLLLITLLSAVLLACILGVAIGKHQLKKSRGEVRAVLSVKERIIYTACLFVGIGCVLIGAFYGADAVSPDGMEGMDGMMGDGVMMEGVEGFEGEDGFVEGDMEESFTDEDGAVADENAADEQLDEQTDSDVAEDGTDEIPADDSANAGNTTDSGGNAAASGGIQSGGTVEVARESIVV